MIRPCITLALSLLSTCLATADTLEEMLARVNRNYQLPGMAAIAFRGDEVLEEACTGIRCQGKTDAITRDDRFHLGSLTKSMTSSLAALLIEEKRMAWDDTVEKLLGKKIPAIHKDYRTVTLRQLCEHRGGMPAHSNDSLWKELWRRSLTHDAAQNRLWYVGELLKRPPAQPVGTFVYSNSGYMAAGLMMETVTQQSWEQLMRERLFTPLAMQHSGFGPAATPADPLAQPWSHIDGKPIAPSLQADNPAAVGPAGTVHASIGDLARYGQWHLRAGEKKGGPALTPASFALLHQSRHFLKKQGGYALGWFEVPRPWAKGNAWNHNGTNTMNYAVIWLAPQQNLGFAVVTNEGQRNAGKATDDVCAWFVKKYASGK
jgi:CubicO group peptidase (beta-lactamase class C family)